MTQNLMKIILFNVMAQLKKLRDTGWIKKFNFLLLTKNKFRQQGKYRLKVQGQNKNFQAVYCAGRLVWPYQYQIIWTSGIKFVMRFKASFLDDQDIWSSKRTHTIEYIYICIYLSSEKSVKY